jgi:hypothetical protein
MWSTHKANQQQDTHHTHLAKHEGYNIDRAQRILSAIRILRPHHPQNAQVRLSVAAVPAPHQLIRVNAIDQATERLKVPTITIESGMNHVINRIENISADNSEAAVGFSERMESNEALEGADLRQLESLLKNKDENRVLGELVQDCNH